jgi:outer membrane receptor for ferrienterochelin and colicin
MRYFTYPTPTDRSHWRTHYWQLEYQRQFGKTAQTARLYGLSGTLMFNKVQTQPPLTGNEPRTRMPFSQSMLAAETYWQWQLPNTQLLAGADYRSMRASSQNHLGGAHTAQNFALYAQAEWQLGRFRPILGARYDDHSVYGEPVQPARGVHLHRRLAEPLPRLHRTRLPRAQLHRDVPAELLCVDACLWQSCAVEHRGQGGFAPRDYR